MCGAIASTLMFTFSSGERERGRGRALATLHAGRVLMYAAAGAALGATGSTFYGAFDHSGAYAFMRWAAAVALGWIGLSVAGLAPPLSAVDRLTTPVASRLRFASAARISGAGGAFASGLTWGLLPCGMVYGALFYAMLSGGAWRGAMVMAGFGLGTLPSVTAVALGVSRFRRLAQAPNARLAVGLGIMALAAASVVVPAVALGGFCLN
jgi:sulfite exporter TauE/SafE